MIHHMPCHLSPCFKAGAGRFFICFLIAVLLFIHPGISASQDEEVVSEDVPAAPKDAGTNAEQGSEASIPSELEEDARYVSPSGLLIPDVLIPFDSGDDTEYAVIVEKESQQLFLYAHDGTLREVYRMSCSTGKKDGPKALEGDLRTPEGIYFFVNIHEDKKLAPIYGIRAFPMDYPNVLDRIADRTGTAIWLHGTNKPLKAMDSSGCVALKNDDIEKVTPYIRLNRTPIVIVDRLSHVPPDPETKARILNFLSIWKDALESGTYHDYLQAYDPEYLPDISWWPEWNRTRKTFQQPLSIKLKKVLIIRHKAVYALLLNQVLKFSGGDVSAGTRKLFLAQKDGRFRIIGEEYQGTADKGEKPFLLAYRNLKVVATDDQQADVEIAADEQEIADRLEQWLEAWSSKEIERYGAYYASDFRSRGMNLKAWLGYKRQLNRKYDYIRVSMDQLKVRKKGRTCRVSFVQTYESNAFKALGIKQLILKHENGQWKIYRETWKKM